MLSFKKSRFNCATVVYFFILLKKTKQPILEVTLTSSLPFNFAPIRIQIYMTKATGFSHLSGVSQDALISQSNIFWG